MNLTCIECKNQVDLSSFMPVAIDSVVECQMCGITLLVNEIGGGSVGVEIMDEGK